MTARQLLLAAATCGALGAEFAFSWILQGSGPQHRITIRNAYIEDGGSKPVNGREPLKDVLHEEPVTEQKDYTGAGTLGDIMASPKSADFSGLVTTDGGLLQASFGIQSPLDRMALTGTLE
jgi:hypothetical protein